MDSDSDDDLLKGSGMNRRKQRAEEKTRKKQWDILNNAMSDSKRLCTSAHMVSTMKKNTVDRDDNELRSRAENLARRFNEEKEDVRNLDEVEGLDILGQDQLLDRERRKELSQAKDTDQSTGWGRRHIVSFCPESCIQMDFYKSEDEAVSALKNIILSGDKENQGSESELLNALSLCIEHSVLNDFLSDKTSVARILQKNDVPSLREDLFFWFKRTSQSASLIQAYKFVEGVHGNLETIIQAGLSPPHNSTFSITHFDSELLVWVPNSETSFFSNETDPCKNIRSLGFVLQYWYLLLSTSRCRYVLGSKDTCSCLVKLCLLGLDYETSSSLTAREIRGIIHRIIPLLLDLVATTEEVMESWIAEVADQILERVALLGPGEKGTDDERDSSAWICHAVVLQSIPTSQEKDGKHIPHRLSNLFRSTLAVAALGSLSSGEAHKMFSKGRISSDMTSICSKAFDAAVGGFVFLGSLGDKMIDSAPLCPAVVECATVAFEAGCILMKLDNDSERRYTKEQASVLAKIMNTLDHHASALRKAFSGMAVTNPHIRQADYFLNTLYQYFQVYIPQAKDAAGEGEIQHKQQTTLDAFRA